MSSLPFKHNADKTSLREKMQMKTKHLAIAIPASIISDTPHLREKTSKIGLIARSAAIFRVKEIIVYPDNAKVNQNRDLTFIALILKYLETPQYLRKRLFELDADLQFAGVLPPLRIPSHPISGKTKHLKVGEYREGVIISESKEGLLVDIGVQQPALLRQKQFEINQRLTLQVLSIRDRVEVQPVDRLEIPSYWGYTVKSEKRSLGQLIKTDDFNLRIATARLGEYFSDVVEAVGKRWENSQRILVAFGAPSRGLHEIAEDEGLNLSDLVDFVVNTVPNQGAVTVRTEEALLASLAIFNMYFNYQ
jgi:methyltransferase